ncbi:hypothetical protein TWF225_000384 [Orbilia oligospora]|uniref:Uncharacterized protein n=1 Tax=Orbilia oligospora TaxID=2813651 RepID=A0A8H2E2W0_ORBOL|nr:hypothetical protein TWF225_000384 [Orbilia oligospora]KAF3254117.1 hypothetical protein TWF128_006247 [Orbilia oligospora]KAF3272054.1 hypothetical protein TWF217_003869 [Orbilia oligospora]KAF3297780.1 hypothetical protein TWF132_006177 [Orbilia oligospora]TGJ69728.1 hypothetical protein EYR41_005747 [Orbilia oligospora]
MNARDSFPAMQGSIYNLPNLPFLILCRKEILSTFWFRSERTHSISFYSPNIYGDELASGIIGPAGNPIALLADLAHNMPIL